MRGSKVRTPVQAKGQTCPSTVMRNQGNLELVMECEDCSNSGLEIPVCFRGVLGAIQQGGMPSAIILRSHIEKRYGVKSTWAMNQLAGILNHADDLMSQISVDSARCEKCAGCLKPLNRSLENLKASVLSMKINHAVELANGLENHSFRKGAKCDQCSGMMGLHMAKISSTARELEGHLLSGAFHIVGVEE